MASGLFVIICHIGGIVAHLFRLTILFLVSFGISFSSVAQDGGSSSVEPIFSTQPYTCSYGGQTFEYFESAQACVSQIVSLMPDGHLYNFSFGHYEYSSKRRIFRFYFTTKTQASNFHGVMLHPIR